VIALPAHLAAHGPEVLYLAAGRCHVDGADLDLLARLAESSPRGRCRICLHPDPGAALHDMVIAHLATVHVPPHRHRDRDESFTVLGGGAVVAFLDDRGQVEQVVPCGPGGALVRVARGRWHCQVFTSPVTLFHESTTGPFTPAGCDHAPFAPDPGDARAVAAFRDRILAACPR
jgi:cupin fold WbuC family metalloprotein